MNLARVIFFLVLAVISVCCRAGGDRSPVIATLNGHDIHRDEFERFPRVEDGGVQRRRDFRRRFEARSSTSTCSDAWYWMTPGAWGSASAADEIEQTTKDNPRMKSSVTRASTRDELARDLLVEKYYRQVALRDVRSLPKKSSNTSTRTNLVSPIVRASSCARFAFSLEKRLIDCIAR